MEVDRSTTRSLLEGHNKWVGRASACANFDVFPACPILKTPSKIPVSHSSAVVLIQAVY